MKTINSVLLFTCLILTCGSHALAQQLGQWVPSHSGLNASLASDSGVNYANLNVAPDAMTPEPTTPEGSGSAGAGGAGAGGGTSILSTANDDQWHFSASPYLWFPGVHGTIGAFGREAGFKASATDLLSHFKFGLMGTGEARRNRVLATLDFMWMRLSKDNAIPFPPELEATYANITANVVILTPKVGYRIINQDKIKADFLTGFRYWYFGESLSFNPSTLGLNFSRSQNWVDPLVGGRIEAALAPKVSAIIGGDVGGWGTGSQIEYQAFGFLGYKVKPNLTLQAGYRYLYFDYARLSTEAAPYINVAFSGVMFGATLNLK
ncbi:MAG: hypothetical protein ACLPHI_16245 [Terriglobales bacterium]|jgi:hypothetical protein